jgi:hypothetical protein
MKPKFDIVSLNQELASAVMDQAAYHTAMDTFTSYYKHSAFYSRQAGENSDRLPINYLKIFADKNIHYTSGAPLFKVVGADDADIREKILYATWRNSGGPILQKKWSRDATKRTLAISETLYNLKEDCVEIKRHDPRHVFFKMSNGAEDRVNVFWIVYPISLQEAQETYGVTPTKDTVNFAIGVKSDPYFNGIDGQKWFTMAIRIDADTRTAWIGNKIIEQPHLQGAGFMSIDICAPFPSDEKKRLGDFYLEDLVPLQAELNDAILRRKKLVRRYSNPLFWARNMKTRQSDDIKGALENSESGIVGVGKDGEVGVVVIPELQMLDNHISEIKADMQRLSGFAAASFGESVGANTSGDALGMYFTPTQKHVEDQFISWVQFYESINAKILRLYDVFGRSGKEYSLDGYLPASTLLVTENGQKRLAKGGSYTVTFTRANINGRYTSKVIMPSIIPKNEIEEQRLYIEAGDKKIVSRRTVQDKLGIESPDDELELLKLEQAEPFLNPDGINTIMNANPLQAPGMMPPALPAPPNLAAGVK